MLFRKALGRLLATPLFTAFAVLSLAGGVAVTTAVYSVVDKLLLSEIGAADPDSLAFVMSVTAGRLHRAGISDEDFDELKRAQQTFAQVSASLPFFAPTSATENTEVMSVEAVDPNYFRTLGLTATAGRLFETADEVEQRRVAVVSRDYVRRHHAGDAEVLGMTVRIAGYPFDVIGVAPDEFNGTSGLALSTMAWIPLASERLIRDEARTMAQRSQRGRLTVFGRLAGHRSVATASAELQTLSRSFDASRPVVLGGGVTPLAGRAWTAMAASAHDDENESVRRIGMLLIGLVGMVLVVACTNLANLVLARGTARQGELAIRMAMGASRGRLIWEQCSEGILLSIFGAIAAYAMFIGVSAMMTQDFPFVMPPMGRFTLSIRPVLNPQALLVAAAAMLLSLIVFGLEPAVQLARTLDVRSALAANASGVRPRTRRQRIIIRWQVAVAAGFFIIATMFIRATIDQARHDSGIDLDRMAIATLSFNRAWDEARIREAVGRVIDRSAAEPSIESAAAATGLPFGIRPAFLVGVARPGDDVTQAMARSSIAAIAGSPALFRTLGMTLVRGRPFNDGDGAAAAPVLIVSEMMARQLFGTTDVVGAPLMLRRSGEPQLATVVGVTRDTDVGSLSGPPRPIVYLPLAQQFDRAITLIARPAAGADGVAALREVIRQVDGDIAIDVVGRGRAVLSGPFELVRSAGRGALYLGAFTLLLSMAGLFGVQSHIVTYRTREFGVRMSLGATARQIKLLVVRDGYRPVAEGLLLGLWGGIAARFVVRAYLETDVAIFDAWMLLIAPVPVVLAALCACYFPAARAARVDPITALRCE